MFNGYPGKVLTRRCPASWPVIGNGSAKRTNMKTSSTPKNHTALCRRWVLLSALFLCFSNGTSAQFRSYAKVYSDNLRGGATLFGNTLTHIVRNNGSADTAKMNSNRANGNSADGNDNSNIQYVDVDGNSGAGAGTRNSSIARLQLPAGGNSIKLARLYWGGRVRAGDFNLSLDTFRRVKIRFGNSGAYTEYAAAQLDKNTQGTGSSAISMYQAYTDITPFIQANGAGDYTVGNVAASVGSVSNGGNYAGWCIVVVYENNAQTYYNSVRVYDGFQQVYNGGSSLTSSVTLTGLNVPSGALSFRDAKMGAMVWEGDANLKQDFLKINNIKWQNPLNAVDNPWNGTITDTGVHVTGKTPNYTNQMGIDIDQFYVGSGYGIRPGDSTVRLEFGTEADQYFPGLFTFVIRAKDPTVVLDKYVSDDNHNQVAEAGEVLTYRLRGRNQGQGNANFTIIRDTLPASVSFVRGSMKVNHCGGMTAGTPFTDNVADDNADYLEDDQVVVFRIGHGASHLEGGILMPNDSFEVEFRVTVKPAPAGERLPAIINVARIEALSDADVRMTDDGTAILEPLNGPVPVTLKSFTALLLNSRIVKLSWATLQEINCDHYEIERSTDGKIFVKTGSVKGSGFTSLDMHYDFSDDISNVPGTVVYYRLRQVDIDGKSSFSKVISVRLKQTGGFTVSPNPFSSYLNLNIDWKAAETATLRLFNMNGKPVASRSIALQKGTNFVQLNDLAVLPAGNYILQISTHADQVIRQVSKL